MIPLILSAVLLLQSEPQKDGPELLTVGHYVEVRGTFDAQGRFVAEKLELLQPDDDLLIGTVPEDQTNPSAFTLLGQPVEVLPETIWRAMDQGSLAGKRIAINGIWHGPLRLTAKSIASRNAGRDRIGARIDELEKVEGGWQAQLMIFTVFLPEGLELVHAEPIENYELAKKRRLDKPARDEKQERNEDELFGEGIRLSEHLRLSGQVEWRAQDEHNFDLDDARKNDRQDDLFRFRTRLDWTPSEKVTGRLELRYDQLFRDEERKAYNSDQNGSLGETYLSFADAFGAQGFDLLIGREKFIDERRWIYNQTIDVVHGSWDRPSWHLDLAGGTTVDDGTPRDKHSSDWIAYLSNVARKQHLAAWALYRDSGEYSADSSTRVSENELHVGVRAVGDFLPANDSWLDFSYQIGSRDVNNTGSRDISAWGYDAGTTWSPGFAQPLYFTFGYALGTGDASTSGSDGTFRQTGFQDNKGKFGGVSSFKYYGELTDPELSNLGILTLGIGARIFEKTSLDLVYHTYTQDVASNQLSFPPVDSNLKKATLNGTNADIGSELDVILGYRRFASWDFLLIGAWFHAGDAFTVGDDAYMTKIQLRYRF